MYSSTNRKEWTITANPTVNKSVFILSSSGDVTSLGSGREQLKSRPVFYLTSDNVFLSGTGTINDPILIN